MNQQVKNLIVIIFSICMLFSCTPFMEDGDDHMDKYFFFTNNDAIMPVLVEGNTESKKFLIVVHGGPGGTGFVYNSSAPAFTLLEEHFAVVYYDQRQTGGSMSESYGYSYSRDEYAEDINVLIKVLRQLYGNDILFYLYGHSWGGELTTQFMTNPDYSKNINGWINEGGGQRIGDNQWSAWDTFNWINLVEAAEIEIHEGENLERWQEILDIGKSINSNNYFEYSDYKYDVTWDYMSDEGKIKNDTSYDYYDFGPGFFIDNGNYAQAVFDRTNQLPYFKNIDKPTLIMYGRYDFICPYQIGQVLYNNISTPEENKQFYIIDSATHSVHERTDVFYYHVKKFIDTY
jgi:pimeloyl-ACP methyl ester carboxylesterase